MPRRRLEQLAVGAWLATLASGAILHSACRPGAGDGDLPDAAASPQASAVPAPLANASSTPTSGTAVAAVDAGALLPVLRSDVPLASDTAAREAVGYTLSAVLRPAELTGPPRAPEVNASGIEAARRKTELRLGIDLAPARMRVVLTGSGFVLPPDTELRARADRYGHVVVWPGAALYRPLAPGSLRALLAERRYDVAPIAPAEVTPRDEPGKRIGIRTRKVGVTTRAASVTFELGRLEGLGEGGVLLCRLLLDLVNAPPATALCGADELPARVEIRWASHGALGFELTGVLRRTDLPTASLLVPPPAAVFGEPKMPTSGVQPLLSQADLAAFRTGPVEVPVGPMPAGDGLLVANTTYQLRLLFLDGVPVAWAAPGGKDALYGLARGRYVHQWRTFLGDTVDQPGTQIVPGAAQIGMGDAGVGSR